MSFVALIGVVLAVSSPGLASVRAESSAAFAVRGDNGFSIDVVSDDGTVTVVASERRPPVATFSAAGAPRPAAAVNGAASIYSAPASGGEPTRVEAALGRLGRIAVSFRPSGRQHVTRLGPGSGLSCGQPLRVVRRLGVFVGTIEFRGEDGYTSVQAASARGSVGTPLPDACAAAASAPRLALLQAADRRAGTHFEARTTGSGVSFLATWRQRLGPGLVVSRRAFAGAPRSAFSFDPSLTSAHVAPPAPFAGAASYRAWAGEKGSWDGSLTATFPGVVVPMTGPRFRAELTEMR